VKDTAGDDDSVYANWSTVGGKVQKLNNTLGNGKTVSMTIPIGNNTPIVWLLALEDREAVTGSNDRGSRMSAGRWVGGIVLSGAVLVGSAGMASADGDVSVPGASASYRSTVNMVTLRDTADDGHAVRFELRTNGFSVVIMRNAAGPGTSVSKRLDLADGEPITYRVCVEGAPALCSPWKADRA
jgi:hypothetical protein